MKQLFLIFSSILFVGTSFADAPSQYPYNPLIEFMVGETPLSKENIRSGKQICAHRLEIHPEAYTKHFAYYINGYVLTALSVEQNYGLQVVRIYNYNNGGSALEEVSRSSSWEIETFNSKRYVVHYHDGFCVYSSKDSQFVIAR